MTAEQEMSETVYPTMASQLSSSSCNGQEEEQRSEPEPPRRLEPEQRLEQELEHTSSALRTARLELGATQEELQHTALRLHHLDQEAKGCGGGRGRGRQDGWPPEAENGGQMAEIREAFSALQRAQEEICQLRYSVYIMYLSYQDMPAEVLYVHYVPFIPGYAN